MREKDLLKILEDLKDNEFEKFKWQLKHEKVGDIEPIKKYQLSKAERQDVVDLMVQKYDFARAVDVFKSILKEIDRNDLVGKLPNISPGAEGQSQEETNMTSHPNSSSVRKNSPDKYRFPLEEVQQQIEKLHKTTGKPTEEFIVLLPLRYKHEESNQFRLCTMENLSSKLAEDRCLMPTDKRSADRPPSYRASHSQMKTGGRQSKECLADPKKSSKERKISIVVLGTADYLKKSLISLILGKDVTLHRNSLMKIETYEDDTYEVTYTPNLYEASKDVGKLFSSKHPDMCLLVVEDGFSVEDVWQQIEKLHKTTGKPTEEFRVMLPLRYKHEESYLFNCYTMEKLFSRLRELAEQRHLMRTSERSADRPPSYRASSTHMTRTEMKIVVLGTDDYLKKSLKSLILGRDVSLERNTDKYEVTLTPNLYTPSDDIKNTFSQQHFHMCLLVVENDVSPEMVQQQIEKLHDITGKPKEEFIVVLPLSCKNTDSYPASCSLGELFIKLAKDRPMIPTNKRDTDPPPPQTSIKGGRSIIEFFTGPRQSLKGNHSDNKVNLVLLGMSGTGKSASGNTILGKKQFLSKASSVPVTTECQVAETEINGTHVRVIDTPDIFNDYIKSSVKNQHVTKCKQLLQSGPCVFLLVIHVSRFTDGERDILEKLEEAFGSEAKEQTVILFTCGEYLQHAKISLKDFLCSCQPELKNIVDQCGRRCVVFDNKTPRQHQVTELMQTVNKMLNK